MFSLSLHHVSVPVRDFAQARAFYCDVLGLSELPRPAFGTPGAWLATGDREIHLIAHPEGTFRNPAPLDRRDAHFALSTVSLAPVLERLHLHGYSEDLAPDDPRHIRLYLGSATGFDQAFVCDPDGNQIEINDAAGRPPRP